MYLEREPHLAPAQVMQKIKADAESGTVTNAQTPSNLLVSTAKLNEYDESLAGRSDQEVGICRGMFSGCSSDDECCQNCSIFGGFCFLF